jgi:hypothetical protein
MPVITPDEYKNIIISNLRSLANNLEVNTSVDIELEIVLPFLLSISMLEIKQDNSFRVKVNKETLDRLYGI